MLLLCVGDGAKLHESKASAKKKRNAERRQRNDFAIVHISASLGNNSRAHLQSKARAEREEDRKAEALRDLIKVMRNR
jgi:hypothetical protein